MSRLQGQLRLILAAILVLVLTHHVSSRSSCKSPTRYLDLNYECVKCPPEPDCPEGSYKSRACGYGFQTECLPCLNCTTVYRTVWRPCTSTSQTKCGGCLPGFFWYMGTCIYEIRHGTTSEASDHLWRNESPTKDVQTVWAVALPSLPTAKTPRVAAESSTTRHVSIIVGAVIAVVFVTISVSLTTVWLKRNYKSTNVEDGCDRKASPTNKRSTGVISALEPDGQLAAEHRPLLQHNDESRSHQGGNYMHGTISTNYEGVSTLNKLWVDFANATLSVDGGCLGLPALDTYLCIDCVERDTDVELAVLKNPKYLPTLAKGESLVSPIISCSPHGLSFQSPALLSFPHCGDMTSSDVTLLVSDTSLSEAPKWREASLDGSCGVSYMVKNDECLVYTSHFTLFGLKAKAKQVKIMIFSKLLPKDKFFEIHVFCVNDTPESLSVVEDQERLNGFCLACPPKEITFLSNYKDVKVKMSLNTTSGWEMPTQHKQVIGYAAVQQNSNPQGQYVTFHLRAVSQDTSCASVHVVASQESSSSVAEFDFLLSLTSADEEDTPYPRESRSFAIERFLSSEQSPTPESFLYCLTGGSSRSTFQPKAISQDLQEKLILGLDVKVDTGNDFRFFADELGFDSSQRTLLDQRFVSPTHCLLIYMELRAQKRRQSSSEMLQELAQILSRIDRSDLATLIESHLQQRPLSIASNSTDSGLGPGSSIGSQLSVATSASGESVGLASPLDKPHFVDVKLEASELLEGDHQNLSPTVVHPARTENQDNRSKVETEV